MKNRFTLILALAFIAVMTMSSLNTAKAAITHRILLEQHTGSWCGWCVDGSYVMDEMIKKYGDKIIGVKLHNGDGMVIPQEGELGQALGLTGFPTGSLSREMFNDGQGGVVVFIDRSNWDAAAAAVMANPATVDVGLKYTLDPTSRELTAYCDASFASSIANEVRFNVIITEDEVTGTGSGYDQQNYLSGRAGYESNPYYKLPKVITGYKHMKVARVYLGGSWGEPNSIGTSVTSGSKYTYVFKYTIPSNWNIDKLNIVGVVQQYDLSNPQTPKFSVLNAINGSKVVLTTQLEPLDQIYQVKSKDEAGELNLNLKNISAGTITYNYKFEKSTRTPSDWSAVLEGANGDLPVTAGNVANLKIKLTPGATMGIGDASIKVWDKAQPAGMSFTQKVTVVSNEIEKFQVIDDEENGKYNLKSEFATAGITGIYEAPSSDFINFYSSLSNVKTVVWNAGEMGTISTAESSILGSIIGESKNLVMTGQVLAFSMKDNAVNLMNSLGIKYDNVCKQGNETVGKINLVGYAQDPITDGFTQEGLLKKNLTIGIKIQNGMIAAPILKHTKGDTVVASRSVLSNSRAVFLGINPQIIGNNAARNNLIKKSLEWAFQGGEQVGPQMSLSVNELQFDKVEAEKSKDIKFRIINQGNRDLIISEITNDYAKDVNHAFSFVGLGTPPFTIAPEGIMEVTIRFTPTKKAFFEGDIMIKTNSLKNADEIITLYGEGLEPNFVNDEAVSATGMFRMSATPNPATTNATISYTLNGGQSQNIELSIMDLNGKQIASLINSNIMPGSYSYNFTTSDYVSGNYFIIAKIAGETVKMPLLIVK